MKTNRNEYVKYRKLINDAEQIKLGVTQLIRELESHITDIPRENRLIPVHVALLKTLRRQLLHREHLCIHRLRSMSIRQRRSEYIAKLKTEHKRMEREIHTLFSQAIRTIDSQLHILSNRDLTFGLFGELFGELRHYKASLHEALNLISGAGVASSPMTSPIISSHVECTIEEINSQLLILEKFEYQVNHSIKLIQAPEPIDTTGTAALTIHPLEACTASLILLYGLYVKKKKH